MPGKGTKRTHSASGLPRRHTRLFLASVEAKKQSWGALSPLPQGFLETVIFSFLGISDKMKFFELNNDLKKQLEGNASLKQALIKELLLTLVTAFQKPRSPYTPEQAELLLKGFNGLTESHSFERQLALFVCNPTWNIAREIEVRDVSQVFRESYERALAKAALLALIRANQQVKAVILLSSFPMSKSEDQLDCILAFMVSGNQDAAWNLIRDYPDLLKQKGRVVDLDGNVYEEITPYQYTLCLKHTQMRLMIKIYLSPEDAALQAREFENGQHRGMQALKLKYEALRNKTHQAYRFCLGVSSDSSEYWTLVIGGLQREWPVHWMQELCSPRRAFNGQTVFDSEEALEALPEASGYSDDGDYSHDALDSCYPRSRGYVGATFSYRCYPKGKPIGNISTVNGPLLIRQGEEYFVFGPRLTGHIEAVIKWELIKLDVRHLNEILQTLSFTRISQVLRYKPALQPLFDAVDRALGGKIVNRDSLHTYVMKGAQSLAVATKVPQASELKDNLEGLELLDKVRSLELVEELKAVKQVLLNSEDEVRVHSQSASFRSS